MVLAAVERDGLALNYAQSSMKDTQDDVVLPAFTQDGIALQYASASMKDNQNVVLAAVKQTSKMVKCKVHMQLTLWKMK